MLVHLFLFLGNGSAKDCSIKISCKLGDCVKCFVEMSSQDNSSMEVQFLTRIIKFLKEVEWLYDFPVTQVCKMCLMKELINIEKKRNWGKPYILLCHCFGIISSFLF